jgi:hypothetical protein
MFEAFTNFFSTDWCGGWGSRSRRRRRDDGDLTDAVRDGGAFPEATCIVDLFRAREHPHTLTQSLEFMVQDRKDE